jgi:hypothetical protein
MYPVKLSTALTVPFFAHDANGDGVTGLVDGGFTKRISKNGGAFAAMTVTISEMENGWYSLPLGTGHTDTLGILSVSLSHASTKRINLQWRVDTNLAGDSVPQTGDSFVRLGAPAGASVSADVAGVQSDTNDIQTRLPAALTGGRMSSAVESMASNVLTAAALASDAVTEIRSTVSGTSDSGTTTTMVDAARTEADTDYWKGSWILFTSGTISGQARLITGFTPGTDTITFTPAATAAVSTQTYEILPAAAVDFVQTLSTAAKLDVTNATLGSQTDDYATAGTVGFALRPSRAATAQAGAAGSITLDASASASDDFYNTLEIQLLEGTGKGQTRTINDYTGSTKVAAITPNWVTNPDVTSIFVIRPAGQAILAGITHTNAVIPTVSTVNALANDSITAAVIANGAIDAATFAAGAIDNAAFNVTETLTANPAAGGITAASFGAGAIDNAAFNVTETLTANPAAGGIVAASFGAGAIDAAAIAADAIGASELAADAVTEIQAGLSTLTLAQIRTALGTNGSDVLAELAQAAPSATPSLGAAIMLLYMALRNLHTSTATVESVTNDAGTVITKATLSDDGTTFSKAEFVTGP